MTSWPEGLYSGKTLRNPVTGQSLTFLELTPDLVVMETTYEAGGPLAPEHLHPAQTEHFVALEGAALVVVEGQERRLEPGKDLTLPAGTRHRFGALADQSCRARWEVRPALRTAEFLGTVFGLAEDGLTTRTGVPPLLRSVQIAREFDAEFRPTHPPRVVQQVAFTVLGGIASALRVPGRHVPGSRR